MSLSLIRRWSTEAADRLAEELSRFERGVDEELRRLVADKLSRFSVLGTTATDQTTVRPGQLARIDTSNGTKTLFLPAPKSEFAGVPIFIVKTVATNTLTVRPISGTINGSSSLALTSVGLRIIVCDGEGYWA